MKKISQETIKAIMDAIYQTNPSVQAYAAIQKAFNDLPEAEEITEPGEEVIPDLK